MEQSPGWPGNADALERLVREQGSRLTATTIRSWFSGTPPQIPNLLKIAPILKCSPLDLYAAWFNEPLSSSGLARIADEISELRVAFLQRVPPNPNVERARVGVAAAEVRADREKRRAAGTPPPRSVDPGESEVERQVSREGG